jgi:hypothetical protein
MIFETLYECQESCCIPKSDVVPNVKTCTEKLDIREAERYARFEKIVEDGFDGTVVKSIFNPKAIMYQIQVAFTESEYAEILKNLESQGFEERQIIEFIQLVLLGKRMVKESQVGVSDVPDSSDKYVTIRLNKDQFSKVRNESYFLHYANIADFVVDNITGDLP